MPFGGTAIPTTSYVYAGNTGTNYANPHAVTSINGNSYAYDNDGNQTSAPGITNTWDYKNRLTQSSLTSGTVSYGYDANDSRVKYSNGTVTTYYVNPFYDIEGVDIVKHILSGDDTVATVKGSGSAAKLYPVHTDHLSGTNVVTNTSGGVEEVSDYMPYGSMRFDQQNGSFNEQRKFAGKDFDKDTSLSYLEARYYDGQIGKFISQDPMFLDLGSNSIDKNKQNELLNDPQQLNSYSYGRNNPLKYVDPDGKKVEVIGRSVNILGHDIGTHEFYRITPDYPNSVSVPGVPAGATEFTLGAYSNSLNPFTNKLVKNAGYAANPITDYNLQGNQKGAIVITPPSGVTDTQLINSLGAAYGSYQNDINYNLIGNINGLYDGNSNNFVQSLGNQAGIGNQISSFKPQGPTPGSGYPLPTTSVYREVKSAVSNVASKIFSIFK